MLVEQNICNICLGGLFEFMFSFRQIFFSLNNANCYSMARRALTSQMIGLEEGVRTDLYIFFIFSFIFFIFFSLEELDDGLGGGSEEGLMHLENRSRLLGCDAACQNIAGDDLLLFCKVYSNFEACSHLSSFLSLWVMTCKFLPSLFKF